MSALEFNEASIAREAAIARLLDSRLQEILTGGDPAIAAEASDKVPAGEVWELIAYKIRLVTDANAANRRTALFIDDGTNEVYRIGGNAQQVASTTVHHTFKSGGVFNQTTINGSSNLVGIGTVTLLSGWRLRTVTDNMQVGDDYSAPVITAKRYSPSDINQYAEMIRAELESTASAGG